MRPSPEVRRLVALRAAGQCEYCRIHEDWKASAHQVDHVIAEKHGGQTVLENLALCCTSCNLRKGSDIASHDPATGGLTPLFNPRTQDWSALFFLEDERLLGRTPEGRPTVEFLRLNTFERLVERAELLEASGYSV